LVFSGQGEPDSLSYCQIRYGGYYYGSIAMIDVANRSPVFQHCTISYSNDFGLRATDEAHPVLVDCEFHHNDDMPIWFEPDALPIWSGDYGSLIHNNAGGYDGLFCGGGAVTGDTRWTAMGSAAGTSQGVPIFIGSNLVVNPVATLELGAGVSLAFCSATNLIVNGTLKARGTLARPIEFTSYAVYTGGQPAAGQWRQLVFSGQGEPDSLSYCQIRYGGYYYGSIAMIDVANRSPVFQHCTISYSNDFGLRATDEAHPVLVDCEFHHNDDMPIWFEPDALPIWSGDYGSLIHNNAGGYDGLFCGGGAVTGDTRWTAMGSAAGTSQGVPIFIGSNLVVNPVATLELGAGVSLAFCSATNLIVNGTLKARGTLARPIEFTSYAVYTGGQPAAGQWRQILLSGQSAPDSLRHCSIRYAGNGNYPAIAINRNGAILEYCIIANNSYDGLQVEVGDAIARYSTIATTSANRYGIVAEPGASVDARFDYWNHPTGPTCAGNPGGQGSRIDGNVSFDPFWTDPFGPTAEIEIIPPYLAAQAMIRVECDTTFRIANASSDCILSYAIVEMATQGRIGTEQIMANLSAVSDRPVTEAAREMSSLLADIPWLAIEDPDGLVAPDSAVDVTIHINTMEVRWQDDPLIGYLVVVSNDAAQNPLLFRVELTLERNPEYVAVDDHVLPRTDALDRAYPNPFNPSVRIDFSTAAAGTAALEIYDLRGRHYATLLSRHLEPGLHTATWRGIDAAGRAAPAGVYVVVLDARGERFEQKITLLK